MDLLKRVVYHTRNKDRDITNIMLLHPKTMIDKDEFDIITNDIGHYDNILQPGTFGGSSEEDVNPFSNKDWIGVVTTYRFYKQAPPLFQEMMSDWSIKV